MPAALLGRKVGMTRLNVTARRWLDKDGQLKQYELTINAAGLPAITTGAGERVEVSTTSLPVTVIQAGPCFISQLKTAECDGYTAVQLAYDEVKPRNSTLPVIAHDAKAGVAPQRFHREVRVSSEELAGYQAGQELTVSVFAKVRFVDIVGTSKGKGFAGTMKRWHHKGMCASHGTERKHRSQGSISGRATNRGFSGRPKKGVHMPGHMGAERVTVRSVEVVGVDLQRNLLLVKGPVPGANKSLVMVREAKRLYRSKAKLAQAS